MMIIMILTNNDTQASCLKMAVAQCNGKEGMEKMMRQCWQWNTWHAPLAHRQTPKQLLQIYSIQPEKARWWKKPSHIPDSVTNTRKSHYCSRSWHEIHGYVRDRLQEILGCCCSQRRYSLPWWSSTLLAETTTDGQILKVAKKSNNVDDGNTVAKCFILKVDNLNNICILWIGKKNVSPIELQSFREIRPFFNYLFIKTNVEKKKEICNI